MSAWAAARVVIGLAAIIIGEVLCDAIFTKGCNFAIRLLFVVFGGVIYYAVMVIILWLKLDPNDLKLFTAIIVAIFPRGAAFAGTGEKFVRTFEKTRKGARLEMLKIEHIAKTFNPGTINQKKALRDLSLELANGDFVTVIGRQRRWQVHAAECCRGRVARGRGHD